ncbi:MAG TPA: nucleotide pyrophosphatase/phosphodiesterase family protein [Actinomycetes bacterium]|nr:nucleotide pyrophosphatase/phosphodiesterase family protein [Actinomycetes bacterium]
MTPGPLRLPDYGGGSLADVMPAALRALGVPPTGGDHAASVRAELHDQRQEGVELGETSRVCVLLVDGLGASALRDHATYAPLLTSLAAAPDSRTITSVFPTTTPIALTSLGTGMTPGEHGITGLLMRLPDGTRVNTLALPSPVDLATLQPRPTAFERAAEAGVEVTRVGPRRFDGDGLTQAGLRGGAYAAAETALVSVAAAGAAVRRGERSLTYVYYGDLDRVGHRRGCTTKAWRAELRAVDAYVDQLRDALPPGTTLLVTSDHGMVDVGPADRWDVATTPELDAGTELVGGDLRGVHVWVRPGAGPDVLAAWRAVVGEHFWVGSRDEAVATGLFGPHVTSDALARLGDVVCAAVGDRNLVDSRVLPPEVLELVGMHGGLTPAEVEVPLLVARV